VLCVVLGWGAFHPPMLIRWVVGQGGSRARILSITSATSCMFGPPRMDDMSGGMEDGLMGEIEDGMARELL
jgi:hypothetical protein